MLWLLGFACLVFLIALVNRITHNQTVATARSRVREITKNCNPEVPKIFVALNVPEKLSAEIPYIAANIFRAARCPQKITIGVVVSERQSVTTSRLLRSRLASLGQPESLSDNFKITISYTRKDCLQQVFDDCYRGEAFFLVVQGRPVFCTDFDVMFCGAFSKNHGPEKAVFTQFPPAHRDATAGFPCVTGGRGRVYAHVEHFRTKSTEPVACILPSQQIFGSTSSVLAEVLDVDFQFFRRDVLRVMARLLKSRLGLFTISAPLLITPDTDAFTNRRMSIESCEKRDAYLFDSRGIVLPNLAHGLSFAVTENEAVIKLGSMRRYNNLSIAVNREWSSVQGQQGKTNDTTDSNDGSS